MPRKPQQRKRTYRPRRRMGRGKRTDGGKVAIMRNTLVPDRMLLKMSYKDNINLSATGPNAYAVANFRLNSLYDPDCAIVNGHQPLGYDQWKVFYSRYRVYKAVVSATFINQTTSGVQCLVLPYNNDVTYVSLDDSSFEQPHVGTKTIGGVNGINRGVITKVVDLPRINGKSHTQYKASDATQAMFDYNPLEQVLALIGVRTINESSSPTVQCIVNITYFAELFDRKKQDISYPPGKDPNAAAQGDYDSTHAQPTGPTGPVRGVY